jgi:hypothetical protein
MRWHYLLKRGPPSPASCSTACPTTGCTPSGLPRSSVAPGVPGRIPTVASRGTRWRSGSVRDSRQGDEQAGPARSGGRRGDRSRDRLVREAAARSRRRVSRRDHGGDALASSAGSQLAAANHDVELGVRRAGQAPPTSTSTVWSIRSSWRRIVRSACSTPSMVTRFTVRPPPPRLRTWMWWTVSRWR